MNDERTRAIPLVDECVEPQDMLFAGQNMPVHRVDNVAHTDEEMAVRTDGGRPFDRRLRIDQRDDMARARRGDGFMQARQGRNVDRGYGQTPSPSR